MTFILILSLFLGPGVLEAQPVEPEEPDIVLPEIILQVEDLSAESVEAGLPPEEEILPPERGILPLQGEIPLPEEKEPGSLPGPIGGLPQSELPPSRERGYALAAEALLGAGSMNYVFSSVSLYKAGSQPRFKLQFRHEALDGMGNHASGSGFNLREEALEGGIKLKISQLALEAQGELKETEQGLQELGPYTAKIYRRGGVEAGLLYPLGPKMELEGRLQSGFASQLLTGSGAQRLTEIQFSPQLGLRLQQERLSLGLKARYSGRSLLDDGVDFLRLGVQALLGLEFLETFKLEATAGWYTSSLPQNLFPFALALSGAPLSSVSFLARGGYAVREIDRRAILDAYPLARLPEELEDARGWFGETSLGLGLLRDLSLQLRAGLFSGSGLLDPRRDPGSVSGLDPLTGLFPFGQREGTELSSAASLRWNLSGFLGLSAGLESQWLDKPEFLPRHTLRLAAEAGEPTGPWRARVELSFQFGADPSGEANQMPLLEGSGRYRVTETITLIAEGKDLLYPLIGGSRSSWWPYQEPGLRGALKVQIDL